MTAEDARRAVDGGAHAIVVSNHGGRQLDGVAASLHVLPEIVAAVGTQCEVLLDGGVRRGSDIVKALALGARAVLLGRGHAYGLAAGGEAGIDRALAIFRADLWRTMKLLGVRFGGGAWTGLMLRRRSRGNPTLGPNFNRSSIVSPEFLKGNVMRFFGLTALFCGLLLCTPAVAADITMLAPASVALGAQALADAFAKETGNKVTLTGGGRQKILDAIKTGTGGDVVVLPAGDMDALTAELTPGSRTPLVRIPVGVAVKASALHPDITTPEKFRIAILASGAVSYTDPSRSAPPPARPSTVILKRPEYAGAKLKPIMGSAVAALSQGKTEMALQMITEIPGVAGIELVGPVPPSVDAVITFDAAVPAHTAQSAEAQAFIRYSDPAAAAPPWKAKGLRPAK